VITTPDEQTGKVETVVGMKMGKQNAHGAGIGVTLQRAEHTATEVDGQRRSVRSRYQVARSRRIWPGDATGTAQYGDSHAHQLAMPDKRVTKTSRHFAPRFMMWSFCEP
jgi:hypothetical protein